MDGKILKLTRDRTKLKLMTDIWQKLFFRCLEQYLVNGT